MILFAGVVWKFYKYLFEDLPDPRTKDYFLINSPGLMIAILTFYVYFVTKMGPRWMKNQEPFNLRPIMIIYNIIQVAINSFLFFQAFRWGYGWSGQFSWLCQPMDFSVTPINIYVCQLCYTYFLIKVADLFDTIFMVLRKRDDHISFLHVYHHTGMCALAWGGVKYLPGGHGTFLGFINTLVHSVMYTYYLLSIIYPQYSERVWWKKYLTQMQMGQFLLVAIHMSLLAFQPNCNYPKFVVLLLVPQNFFMFLLFCDFYRKAYCKPKSIISDSESTDTNKSKIHSD